MIEVESDSGWTIPQPSALARGRRWYLTGGTYVEARVKMRASDGQWGVVIKHVAPPRSVTFFSDDSSEGCQDGSELAEREAEKFIASLSEA
jgi:hypothetical protein